MSSVTALFGNSDEAQADPKLVAFLLDTETQEALVSMLPVLAPESPVYEGGVAAAIGTLQGGRAPGLVIVDVSDTEDPVGGVQMLQSACGPASRILAIGTINDVHLYRSLIEAGAHDYLVKPVSPEAFARAISAAEARPAAPAAPNGGKAAATERNSHVLTFMGSRGGVGATTVAVNTAWLLAHELDKSVVILDLDLRLGTVALALDLEPTHGLREVLESPHRIDNLFISSAMARESDKLFVLSAEEPLGDHLALDPDAFDTLLSDLKANFDWVIVDLPRTGVLPEQRVVNQSDKVVLVSDLSLAGMRDAMRMSGFVKQLRPDVPLVIMVNKVGANPKTEVPQAEFSRGIAAPVAFALPYEPAAAGAAAAAGRPIALSAKGSKLLKALRKSSLGLTGAAPEKKKSGRLLPGLSLKRKG
jgi:pilus assembly protein CpaE